MIPINGTCVIFQYINAYVIKTLVYVKYNIINVYAIKYIVKDIIIHIYVNLKIINVHVNYYIAIIAQLITVDLNLMIVYAHCKKILNLQISDVYLIIMIVLVDILIKEVVFLLFINANVLIINKINVIAKIMIVYVKENNNVNHKNINVYA